MLPSLSAGATGAGVRIEKGQPLVSMNSLSLTSMFTAWSRKGEGEGEAEAEAEAEGAGAGAGEGAGEAEGEA